MAMTHLRLLNSFYLGKLMNTLEFIYASIKSLMQSLEKVHTSNDREFIQKKD